MIRLVCSLPLPLPQQEINAGPSMGQSFEYHLKELRENN